MIVFRVIFVTLSLMAIGAAGYASYRGIGGESADLDRSVRLGSSGGGYISSTSVK